MGRSTAQAAIVGLFAAAMAGGCTDRRDSATSEALRTRLEQIDERMALIEKRVESMRALRRHLRDLERRLVRAETRLAPEPAGGATAQPPSTPDRGAKPSGGSSPLSGFAGAWSIPNAAGGRPQLPPAVAALLEEFRTRLERIQEQYRDAPTSPERQQAMNEVYQWYRERARAAWYPEHHGEQAEPPDRK